MPWRAHASASSFIGSRPNGVASTMSYSVTFESYMQKPSWCLAVIVRYFWPARFASETQASASNFVGLNCLASCSYSAIGIRARS